MLVPLDNSHSVAVERLKNAGFCHSTWSYGSLDSGTFTGEDKDPFLRRIHADIARQYQMLDDHSTRFQFPLHFPGEFRTLKLILLCGNYVEIRPPLALQSVDGYTQDGIFYYPDAVVLLESIIKTLLKDGKESTWRSMLETWAISYVCGYLDVSLDALDKCPDTAVREWFSKESY